MMAKNKREKIIKYLSENGGFKVHVDTRNIYNCQYEFDYDSIYFYRGTWVISLQTISDIKALLGCKDITVTIDPWGDGFHLTPVYK